MNLTVDIGNTNTRFSLFKGQKLVQTYSAKSNKPVHLPSRFNKYRGYITQCGISSVVPSLTKLTADYIRKKFNIKPIIINNYCKLPIVIKVKNSSSLGPDRICNAVFGYEFYSRKSAVIICSFGTANTIDVILKNGEFIGGLIAPGISLNAIALNQYTGKLPLLSPKELKYSCSIAGNDTYSAIQSGLLNYPLYATFGIIKSFEKEYKTKFKLVITGGNGKIFHKKFNINSEYIENTVLPGINYILNYRK